jgi:3,4-dihydroxy 2-butanone 4-phosphate synthase / GTP cyclohydrolase II
VRIHSECGTGDLFGSLRCDCEQQLHSSLARIDEEGSGALLYLVGQEGRGIGLTAKIRAYALQENGHNTITANLQLGLPIDSREYASAAAVLKELGFTSIRLITNNPDKISWLAEFGIEVTDRIHSSPKVNKFNERYLNDKRDMMGHFDNAAQAAGSAGGTVHKRVR